MSSSQETTWTHILTFHFISSSLLKFPLGLPRLCGLFSERGTRHHIFFTLQVQSRTALPSGRGGYLAQISAMEFLLPLEGEVLPCVGKFLHLLGLFVVAKLNRAAISDMNQPGKMEGSRVKGFCEFTYVRSVPVMARIIRRRVRETWSHSSTKRFDP